ncbi:MAG TPA: FxsA family protein [Thiotrichales bacterium]|nr:FxsA family protein [Thiotrichales bacterium]
MNAAFVFLLLLVGAPLVELYVLIQVGSEIGALPTIGLSIFTAVLGAWLVRMQGISVLFRVQQSLARGEAPALEMLEGALLMMAGVSLLFPGFITDAMGFLLLVPPLRRRLILAVLRHSGTLKPPPGGPPGEGSGPRIRVIEGDWRREE